ncbi:hypothetical protein OF83DRAFT_1179335 [Amylostereum chailletii]|nr:hypothetical protein OF83DRAFT_1179335 [Amylostereum chailletii]
MLLQSFEFQSSNVQRPTFDQGSKIVARTRALFPYAVGFNAIPREIAKRHPMWRSYRSLAVVPWCKGPRGVRRRLVATASNSSAPKSPQHRSEVLNFLAELLSEDNPDFFAATEPSKVAHETDGLKPEAVASFIRPTGDIPARKADFSEISIITSYNWIDTAKPTIIVPGAS